MSYHGLGKIYAIDMPTWGPLPAVTLRPNVPIDEMVDDAMRRAGPTVENWVSNSISMAASQISEAVVRPMFQAIDAGAIIVERTRWSLVIAAGLGGIGLGWLIHEVIS